MQKRSKYRFYLLLVFFITLIHDFIPHEHNAESINNIEISNSSQEISHILLIFISSNPGTEHFENFIYSSNSSERIDPLKAKFALPNSMNLFDLRAIQPKSFETTPMLVEIRVKTFSEGQLPLIC